MEKYRPQLLLTLSSLFLLSCGGGSSGKKIRLELLGPDADRQIQTSEASTKWRVDISVNFRAAQTFYFDSLETTQSVSVTGVQADQMNSISTTWFEVLHGYEVEISYQPTQNFFANEYTTLVANHEHTLFDYDNDGVSNLDERLAGTCVWSSGESCLDSGQKDVPTDNVLIHGDFSDGVRGVDYWWSTSGQQEVINGEFCTFPADYSGGGGATILGFRKLLFLETNNRYTIEFDVRAQANANLSLSLNLPELGYRRIYSSSDIEVTTSSEKIVRSFNYRQDSQNGARLSIGTAGDPDNLFCFDDVKLIREPL